MPERGRRRAALLLALALAPLLGALVYDATPLAGHILCPIRAVTGFECAGCGLTRAWCAAARGDLARAFAAHPLGPLLCGLVAFEALGQGARLMGARPAPARWQRLRMGCWIGAALALLAVGLWRALTAVLHLGVAP